MKPTRPPTLVPMSTCTCAAMSSTRKRAKTSLRAMRSARLFTTVTIHRPGSTSTSCASNPLRRQLAIAPVRSLALMPLVKLRIRPSYGTSGYVLRTPRSGTTWSAISAIATDQGTPRLRASAVTSAMFFGCSW